MREHQNINTSLSTPTTKKELFTLHFHTLTMPIGNAQRFSTPCVHGVVHISLDTSCPWGLGPPCARGSELASEHLVCTGSAGRQWSLSVGHYIRAPSFTSNPNPFALWAVTIFNTPFCSFHIVHAATTTRLAHPRHSWTSRPPAMSRTRTPTRKSRTCMADSGLVSHVLLFLVGDPRFHFLGLTASEDAGHGKNKDLEDGRRQIFRLR